MSPDSPSSGREPHSPIENHHVVMAPPPPPVFVKAKSDMDTLKIAEAVKPSWAKMVARSASKV